MIGITCSNFCTNRNYKPPKTTRNHLKPSATNQSHPSETICNPPELPATTRNHQHPVRI